PRMAPKATREQVRQDLVRLLRGLDLYRDWRIARWQAVRGPDATFDPDDVVEPGAQILARFDAYAGPHYVQFLRDIQTWYSVTAGELTWMRQTGDADLTQAVAAFLSDVQARTGISFLAEAGLLKKTADKVVKRGKIANDEEWYLLKDLLDDTTQGTVSPQVLSTLSTLAQQYEVPR
ncbi:hypothetical protein, partial [Pseudooceanicola nitratireducens]|uniref:hypothetical protein n=1 Tax=Pseudooceanicola nitratireducens TaxID=517719 RepID=UPI003517E85B